MNTRKNKIVAKGWSYELWDTEEGYIMHVRIDHGVVETSHYYLLTAKQMSSEKIWLHPGEVDRIAEIISLNQNLFKDQIYQGNLDSFK